MASGGPVRLPLVIELDGTALSDRLDLLQASVDSTNDLLRLVLQALSAQGVTLAAVSADTRSIMADLTPIATEVTGIAGEVDSTVVLLNRLADLMDDVANDPAEVQALAAQVRAQRTRLAEAVAAVPDEPGPAPV
jgi:hypothetical protein